MNHLIKATLVLLFCASCALERNRPEPSGTESGRQETAAQQTDTLQIRTEEATRSTIAIYDRILGD